MMPGACVESSVLRWYAVGSPVPTQIRFRREGSEGYHAAVGDLVVDLVAEPHPNFTMLPGSGLGTTLNITLVVRR